MPVRKVIKELPSQVLQRRMAKIKLEGMSNKELIEYADYLLKEYNKLFNEVRVDFLLNKMNVPENDPLVETFFDIEYGELQNGD